MNVTHISRLLLFHVKHHQIKPASWPYLAYFGRSRHRRAGLHRLRRVRGHPADGVPALRSLLHRRHGSGRRVDRGEHRGRPDLGPGCTSRDPQQGAVAPVLLVRVGFALDVRVGRCPAGGGLALPSYVEPLEPLGASAR